MFLSFSANFLNLEIIRTSGTESANNNREREQHQVCAGGCDIRSLPFELWSFADVVINIIIQQRRQSLPLHDALPPCCLVSDTEPLEHACE